ncbi:hypothetical protein N0V84_005292 [Fusarium piperis]|uniref:Uncharacterized protein n=1 Tax=Fusarium piperis TaxID=1435070 RepID=A0A9W9BPM2_9HYPO|nr:hypothetical protein N0V84_005292 [Fusarium piperis]
MSALNTITRVLGPEYTFDPSVGFDGMDPGDHPCIGCLSKRHIDSRLYCVVDKDPLVCVCCKHYNQKCGAIPDELLGAAQWYWNTACGYFDRCPLNVSAPATAQQMSDRTELWRVITALDSCGSAWANIKDWHVDPPEISDASAAALHRLQELASIRELVSIMVLQSAGMNSSVSEIRARMDAAQPAYVRDDTKVQALLRALRGLDDAENKSVSNEKRARSLRYDMPDRLVDRMTTAYLADAPGPKCAVHYVGTPSCLSTE